MFATVMCRTVLKQQSCSSINTDFLLRTTHLVRNLAALPSVAAYKVQGCKTSQNG